MIVESKSWTYQLKDSAADSKLKLLKAGETFGVEKPGGEKRLHIGSINNEDVFDDYFFPNGDKEVLFEVSKIDLIQYLLSAKDEYTNPIQSYRLPINEYYSDLLEYIWSIEEESFTIPFVKNVDSVRYYLARPSGNPASRKYLFVNKICLPIVTVFNLIRNKNDDDTYNFYLKPVFVNPTPEDSKQEYIASHDTLPLQQIFYGAPGTGKSDGIKRQEKDFSEVIRTTFHPDSDYSSFVGAYKPIMKKVRKCVVIGKEENAITASVTKDDYEEKISYSFVKQAFLKAYISAWQGLNEQKKVLLVIEEINRGNCAQIFGDLFQLLDRETEGENIGYSTYPIITNEDLRTVLAEDFKDIEGIPENIKSGEELLLPPNLHIWATMNTSDQSLFPIDSAFKRRWDWVYKPIKYDNKTWKVELKDGSWCEWTELQQTLNDLIYDATESEDKMLGDWFVKAENDKISEDVLVGKIVFYLWNDVAKVDAGKLFDLEVEKRGRKRKVIFSDFYEMDGSVSTDIVKSWLNKIGIELMEKNSDAEDYTNTEDPSRNRYKLNNGALESLKDIANHVVRDYAENNPTMNAQQIRDLFVDAYKGCGIAHVVETDEEYQLRKGQASWERSASTVILPNGEKVHVCTQLRAKNEDDNFFNFIKVTKEKGWGEITE